MARARRGDAADPAGSAPRHACGHPFSRRLHLALAELGAAERGAGAAREDRATGELCWDCAVERAIAEGRAVGLPDIAGGSTTQRRFAAFVRVRKLRRLRAWLDGERVAGRQPELLGGLTGSGDRDALWRAYAAMRRQDAAAWWVAVRRLPVDRLVGHYDRYLAGGPLYPPRRD